MVEAHSAASLQFCLCWNIEESWADLLKRKPDSFDGVPDGFPVTPHQKTSFKVTIGNDGGMKCFLQKDVVEWDELGDPFLWVVSSNICLEVLIGVKWGPESVVIEFEEERFR
jgi:hypothetical protein